MPAYTMLLFIARSGVFREVLALERVADLRHAAHLAAEPEVSQLLEEADARPPFAQRPLEGVEAVRVGCDDAHAGDDDPLSSFRTPSPDAVVWATSVPSAANISMRARSLLRRQKMRSPRIVTVSPGSTAFRNSDSASTNSVVKAFPSSAGRSRANR